MKVTFCTREDDNLSGGQNTWLCRFVPELKRRGIESRVLCFTLSAEKELPTVGICHVGVDHSLYPGLLDQFVFGRAPYQVSAFVPVSKYLEQDVLKRHPKGILVQSIHCGVPIPRDMAKKPHGRLRLAYVGRLTEEAKRVSEVTRALCQAVREVPG